MKKKITLWNERVNDSLVDRDLMKALLANPRKDGEHHKKCLVDEVMYIM